MRCLKNSKTHGPFMKMIKFVCYTFRHYRRKAMQIKEMYI